MKYKGLYHDNAQHLTFTFGYGLLAVWNVFCAAWELLGLPGCWLWTCWCDCLCSRDCTWLTHFWPANPCNLTLCTLHSCKTRQTVLNHHRGSLTHFICIYKRWQLHLRVKFCGSLSKNLRLLGATCKHWTKLFHEVTSTLIFSPAILGIM